MKSVVLLWLVGSTTGALANPPSDFSLRQMTTLDGQLVEDSSVLSTAFDSLAKDLGTAIAIPSAFPAETPGASGFDISIGNAFVILPASNASSPTHWQRATGTAEHETMVYIPSITARKGLPLSMELGATASWLAGGQSGAFGGFFRAALVEGYKPWPDLTLHAGYNGLVGHPELELGVMDVGVTLGSTYAFGSVANIRQAQMSPWLDFTLLQMFTKVRLDDATKSTLFGDLDESATEDKRGQNSYWLMPRIGAGLQITNGTVLFRLAGTWTPQSVPSLFVGMGFSY